jgi:hypothetical protein
VLALRIDVDGAVTELPLLNSANWDQFIKDAIGGWFEVHLVPGPMLLWLDDKAAPKQLGINQAVSRMLQHIGAVTIGPVRGPVVLTGTDCQGQIADLAPAVCCHLSDVLTMPTGGAEKAVG